MNKFSKKIVALVVMLNVAFTAAVFYAFLKVGSEPTTLTTAWFAFTTGELWMLAGIRKAKIKQESQGNESGGGVLDGHCLEEVAQLRQRTRGPEDHSHR